MNSTWLITSELANQRARKVLFTCVVYTNMLYSLLHTRKKKTVSVGILVPPKRRTRHSISLIVREYYCYENNTKKLIKIKRQDSSNDNFTSGRWFPSVKPWQQMMSILMLIRQPLKQRLLMMKVMTLNVGKNEACSASLAIINANITRKILR